MKEWLSCKLNKGSNSDKVIVSSKILNTSFEASVDDVDISSGLIKILDSKRIDNTKVHVSIPFLENNRKCILKLKINQKDLIKI